MSEILSIGYWIFIILSTVIGILLLCHAGGIMDNENDKYDEKTVNSAGIELVYLLLGIGVVLFSILYENKIYPFVLGLIYWFIYLLFIKKIWKYILRNKDEGYKIIKRGHKEYNDQVYEFDKKCPTCNHECKKQEEVKCGNRIHYLFECPKCGTVWTGHFFR